MAYTLPPENMLRRWEDSTTRYDYQWACAIDYDERMLNVLECIKTKKENDEEVTSRFLWVTNLPVDNDRAENSLKVY